MVKADAILAKVISGHGRIQFGDFQKFLVRLGFRLDRARGSLCPPKGHPPIERQPIGNEAKSFQVGQLKDMIAEFDLKLEKG